MQVSDKVDGQIRMLRQILAALSGKKLSKEELAKISDNGVWDLRSNTGAQSDATLGQNGAQGDAGTIAQNVAGTTWQKVTASETYFTEAESMTFAAQGMAVTADGRTLDFGVSVTMARAFNATYSSLEEVEYIRTDPLVINLNSNVTTVSDEKFFFDLNADGTKEEVSFAGDKSGFLVYDKNGDGQINDGRELFGTRSGDGFYDLSGYDQDGNGWIDEADDIFSKLQVWTKDENGNDILLDLKKADVGAIYLGSADTQFALNDAQNRNMAMIRKTGVYLKESGGAGSISHVDLTL